MYIDKKLARGYNEYVSADVNDGEGCFMDVAVLVMEDGDTFSFNETEKELAWVLMKGKADAEFDGKVVSMERSDPFVGSPWCLHICAGDTCKLTAHGYCEIYVQKTYNDKKFPAHLYTSEEVDTWKRGTDICSGCVRRDVRTYFDYENAPYSNMVLGEVVNLPGKWSSYPPHDHPQPEAYLYFFERPEGFGAGWSNGSVTEIHDHGLSVITSGTHAQVMAPGYPCCYTWGIRHLPGNPWEKTRNDDPVHAWLYDPNAKYWNALD